MPKLQILSLRRPPAVTETKTFSEFFDGASREVTLTISTRRETAELADINELGMALYRDYGPGNVPLQWGSQDLLVTKNICYLIATVMSVDASPSEDKFSFHEWLVLSAGMRRMFTDITEWVSSVLGKPAENQKDENGKPMVPNGSAARTAISYAPQPNMATPATRRSSRGKTQP